MLLRVKAADLEAQSNYKREEKAEYLKEIGLLYQEVLDRKQCVSLKTLEISGKDLIERLCMEPGKQIGEVLNYLLDLVVEDSSRNQKDFLLRQAGQYLEKAHECKTDP